MMASLGIVEKKMSDEEKDALCRALYFAKLSDEEAQNFKDMLKEIKENE